MVVLDTDVLIYYLRDKNDSYSKIKNLKKKEESLNTTIFNVAELYKGCYSMKNVAKGLMKVKLLIDALDDIFLFENDSRRRVCQTFLRSQKKGAISWNFG